MDNNIYKQGNRHRTLSVMAGTAVLACMFLFSCKHKETPPAGPVPVNLITVQAQTVVFFDRYTATTVAMSQVNLLAQVQGYITGIYFKDGTHVKKGQKLYEIDRRLYEGNYNEALANLKVAEGTLKQAKQDADRYEYLNSEKAVAKQVYDHAMITLQNSQNAYQAAAETLKNAKTNLTYSIITAPFDGTIGFSQVKMGDLMNVGSTILNTISTDNPMAVDFLINEKQLDHFEQLQNPKYTSFDSLFTLLMPNGKYYNYTGKISAIDRAVNAQTGSIRVRLVYDNPTSELRAGMSCVVKVHNQDSTKQIVVPSKAIVEQMGEFFVYVARDSMMSEKGGSDTATTKKDKKESEDKEKDGDQEKKGEGPQVQTLVALQKKVQTGATIGADVVILEGLSEGDKVVVDGLQSLHDGARITTANKMPPAQAGKGGK